MKILMEPTPHILIVDGVECRVWNGVTEDHNQVFVMVHRIATRIEIQELEERNPESISLKGENGSEI